MYITILGRQPALGAAELEQLYGADNVRWFSRQTALVDSPGFDFEVLGGSQKAGRVVLELDRGNWLTASRQIVQHYTAKWRASEHKITLGISAYGFKISPRDVQKTGLLIKKKLRDSGTSLRLIPNPEVALNTAASHHNKLGLSPAKVELLVVQAPNKRIIIAESVGAQNITALAARDQARPRTDAFVGMLPPKLARMMVNLSGKTKQGRLWDPFCGTGTVLQEARLKGIGVYGSDLSPKMVDYTTENMQWLDNKYQISSQWKVFQADAAAVKLDAVQQSEITSIVCEAYLGQPFSALPKPAKLAEVRGNCNHIISQFLVNIRPQINPNTTLVVAVPAWRGHSGDFTHLPLVNQLSELGYQRLHLQLASDSQIIYYRENQVVARQILLLKPL